ncbi:hypothetical protein GPJ56_009783 [Histomonas meleagridis]|uniref:uncharacterized protein n=1 Tax=Histomonas meleagridis TaxID=135588 RepID=UPI00355946AF|nr:hypothetical protein GPJ56_009783 [Histomonas meleagridis]KAH0798800.1 hypothetical protein GO595_008665 [Histomonas meleagridis]
MSELHVKRQLLNIIINSQTQHISGFTEIDIEAAPQTAPDVIFLNARQMQINSVSINGTNVEYQYINSRKALEFNNGPIVRDAAHFSSVCKAVLQSPELIIPIHSDFSFPLVVKIEFEVNDDSTAIIRDQNCIFTDNKVDGPASWFPCMGETSQRSYFTLNITYDALLVIIGPGEKKHLNTDTKLHTNTIQFKVGIPVVPKAIGFICGNFNSEPLPDSNESFFMYYYQETDKVKNTLKPIPDIFNEVSNLFAYEDPLFSQYSFVFLPFLSEPHSFPGIVCFTSRMLLQIGNVNVIPRNLQMLSEVIIEQYILYLFPIPDPKNEWLQIGLIKYYADQICSKYLTQCFPLDQRWNDLNYLYDEDIHPSIVLDAIDPTTLRPYPDEYLKIKSKLLINMISQSMANQDAFLLLLRSFLKDIEDRTDFPSTYFIKQLPMYCPAIDFKAFKEQWLPLTAIAIKNSNKEELIPDINEMRNNVLQNTNYFECRAIIFKCLLYLAFYFKEKISFAHLISDIKKLVDAGDYIVASKCLREIHRFIHNSVFEGSSNKFESYLLFIPKDKTRDDVKDAIINDSNQTSEIIETLWEIMTIKSKYISILRSESLRVYTSLFGDKIPKQYLHLTTENLPNLEIVVQGVAWITDGKRKIPLIQPKPNIPEMPTNAEKIDRKVHINSPPPIQQQQQQYEQRRNYEIKLEQKRNYEQNDTNRMYNSKRNYENIDQQQRQYEQETNRFTSSRRSYENINNEQRQRQYESPQNDNSRNAPMKRSYENIDQQQRQYEQETNRFPSSRRSYENINNEQRQQQRQYESPQNDNSRNAPMKRSYENIDQQQRQYEQETNRFPSSRRSYENINEQQQQRQYESPQNDNLRTPQMKRSYESVNDYRIRQSDETNEQRHSSYAQKQELIRLADAKQKQQEIKQEKVQVKQEVKPTTIPKRETKPLNLTDKVSSYETETKPSVEKAPIRETKLSTTERPQPSYEKQETKPSVEKLQASIKPPPLSRFADVKPSTTERPQPQTIEKETKAIEKPQVSIRPPALSGKGPKRETKPSVTERPQPQTIEKETKPSVEKLQASIRPPALSGKGPKRETKPVTERPQPQTIEKETKSIEKPQVSIRPPALSGKGPKRDAKPAVAERPQTVERQEPKPSVTEKPQPPPPMIEKQEAKPSVEKLQASIRPPALARKGPKREMKPAVAERPQPPPPTIEKQETRPPVEKPQTNIRPPALSRKGPKRETKPSNLADKASSHEEEREVSPTANTKQTTDSNLRPTLGRKNPHGPPPTLPAPPMKVAGKNPRGNAPTSLDTPKQQGTPRAPPTDVPQPPREPPQKPPQPPQHQTQEEPPKPPQEPPQKPPQPPQEPPQKPPQPPQEPPQKPPQPPPRDEYNYNYYQRNPYEDIRGRPQNEQRRPEPFDDGYPRGSHNRPGYRNDYNRYHNDTRSRSPGAYQRDYDRDKRPSNDKRSRSPGAYERDNRDYRRYQNDRPRDNRGYYNDNDRGRNYEAPLQQDRFYQRTDRNYERGQRNGYSSRTRGYERPMQSSSNNNENNR